MHVAVMQKCLHTAAFSTVQEPIRVTVLDYTVLASVCPLAEQHKGIN